MPSRGFGGMLPRKIWQVCLLKWLKMHLNMSDAMRDAIINLGFYLSKKLLHRTLHCKRNWQFQPFGNFTKQSSVYSFCFHSFTRNQQVAPRFQMILHTTTQLYRFKITHIVKNTLWTLAWKWKYNGKTSFMSVELILFRWNSETAYRNYWQFPASGLLTSLRSRYLFPCMSNCCRLCQKVRTGKRVASYIS